MDLYVGNLADSVSIDELRQAFERYGTVLKTSIATDSESGKPLGYGIVNIMPDTAACVAILELDLTQVKGRRLSVREFLMRERPERRLSRAKWTGIERRLSMQRRQETQDKAAKVDYLSRRSTVQ